MAVIVPTSNEYRPATIPSGGTKTPAVPLYTLTLCGVFVPAAMTGTTLTFEACDTETGTYVPVKDSTGTAISCTIPTSGGAYIGLAPANFAGIAFVKAVSGSSEAADRTLKLATRGIG